MMIIFPLFLLGTPELGLEGQVSCGVCHLDPCGGGVRAGPGFGLGVRVIPFSPRKEYVPPYLNEAETITYGGDLRTFYVRNSGGLSSYTVMEGSIYLADVLSDRVTVYIDKGLWGGTEIAGYIWNLFLPGTYLKFGLFKPPFGMKTDDHSAYSVVVAGPRSEDAGIEAGYSTDNLTISVAHQNGAPGAMFDSDTLRTLTARAIYFGPHFMLGPSVYLKNDRKCYGASVGLSAFNFYPWADGVWTVTPDGYSLDASFFLYWKPHRGIYPFYACDMTRDSSSTGERQRIGLRFIPVPFLEVYGYYGIVKNKGSTGYEDNEAHLAAHFYY